MFSIKGIILKYILKKSKVRFCPGSSGEIADNVEIQDSTIMVLPGAKLTIGEGCIFKNVNLYVGAGEVSIGRNCLFQTKDGSRINIIVDNGSVIMDHHSKLACKRVWVRFGGCLSVGKYTNVNDGSEIRCDESVSIGDYNQISYNVRIWDTNTHTIMPVNERRRIAEEKFPYFGFEETRPKSAPVCVGNDCWIGESATILKGSQVGNGSIIGFGALISGETIPKNSTVVCRRELAIFQH